MLKCITWNLIQTTSDWDNIIFNLIKRGKNTTQKLYTIGEFFVNFLIKAQDHSLVKVLLQGARKEKNKPVRGSKFLKTNFQHGPQ